ncbi:hypothetical protein [Thiolapillus sp.]|uniref:hypothetical protein n=1 Tax=Thiolapillus sp. TaxID=2017437 RepID=UPI0025E43BFA|nr:hypothetical protein [Thiolapillus sp.]
MVDEKFKNYIYDLGVLLKEKAREAKADKDASIGTGEADYKIGYLMGLHEVVSLMKQQAEAFDIEQGDVGLGDLEPESDLL